MRLNQISPQRLPVARPARRRPSWWPRLAAATLTACLAAACPAAAATAGTAAAAAPPPLPLNCGAPDFPLPCYTPHAYEVAYGIAPLLRRGIDGRGQTVVLPELAEPPSSHGVIYSDIRKDLAALDTKFALPAATLHVINTIAWSKAPDLAGSEEVEDTEMVHAFAPAASLDVVLVPQNAQSSSLLPASGTSAATPLWAGVIALADQQAGQHLGFINPAIYHIASSPAYHKAFHDVITGDNSVLWPTGVFTGYTAGPGWDPVTGWGSPNAQYLIPLLARTARSRP